MSKRTLGWVVFAAAFLALAWNVWNAGIASGYIDPVRKLGAQDEAVYTREAIHMATRGDWLTMTYLDRYVLFKPPLLMWLSGASAKLLGISIFSLRLPSLLAGAWICLLAFLMSRRAGYAAAVLLVSDRLFHTLARVNMTDILLCACVAAAFYFFERDPTLVSPRAFWGFAAACALAILAKSIAGLLPFAVVVLFLLLYRGPERPRLWRLVQAGAAAAALALPWHLYQLLAHYNWFLAEYLGVQLLAFGGKPPQTSQESQMVFYLSRLWLTDPVLFVLALAALPAWWQARRRPQAVLYACWLAVFAGALLIFQYRSVQYMLPLIPVLALVAADYAPFLNRRVALAALFALFCCKAALPGRAWGNPYSSGSTLALAPPLANYCELNRPNDLLVLESDDEFYSSVLPLARVRYGWSDPGDSYLILEPHLRYLGILLPPADFLNLAATEPEYLRRLRAWNLPSSRPIGSAIAAHVPGEFKPIILSRPGSDFLLPRNLVPSEALATHTMRFAAGNHVFLLSRHPVAVSREGPRWTCQL